MLRLVSKSVSSSDLWGVVTLAVFIGLICTLALSTKGTSDHGYRYVSSTPSLTDRL
ncbi:MAG: hypothetical protein Q7T86_13460 [Hyphomicrobiaceae bacterium]|nr:hypothetical protein [Hyphomicrobiaceae bacterium]